MTHSLFRAQCTISTKYLYDKMRYIENPINVNFFYKDQKRIFLRKQKKAQLISFNVIY